MKGKIKDHKEILIRNFNIKRKKYKNPSSLKISKANYIPEFTINKTIKDYVTEKLEKDYAAEKLENNKTLKQKQKNKNKKSEKNSLLKVNKNKSCFNKHLNCSDIKPKNGGNFEETNNHDSIKGSTFNISNIEGSNDNLNRGYYTYREMNHNINIYMKDIKNESHRKYDNNVNNEINGKLDDKINDKISVHCKRHLINKIKNNNPKKLKNLTIKNNFNNDYYTYANNYNSNSYNNIFEGNGICKRTNKFKYSLKDILPKEKASISQDKKKPSFQLNKKKSLNSNYDKDDKKKKNLKLRTNSEKETINGGKIASNLKNLSTKKFENGLIIKGKEDENIINHIIQNIFKNARKMEKKLSNKKEIENRLYSPLANKYKKGNVRINKNTSVIKCRHSNKEKIFIEYQNQVKKK